ncbi:MAG: helix-turn-helix domain-containing protein [Roseburia sp.]|nr:helix-turn-helix domain-containing protein [Roseburia sp.]
MDQKKTGQFIKTLRREKQMTQEQLAEIMGVTNRSVSRWENGVNMPDFDLVMELANYFDVGIEELLDGERKTDRIDKKSEEVLLKVADYSNRDKMVFTRRMHWVFLAAVAAFVVYTVLEMQGLTAEGAYENIADFCLGAVLGVLLCGALYTSRYGARIRAFKQRVLKRQAE